MFEGLKHVDRTWLHARHVGYTGCTWCGPGGMFGRDSGHCGSVECGTGGKASRVYARVMFAHTNTGWQPTRCDTGWRQHGDLAANTKVHKYVENTVISIREIDSTLWNQCLFTLDYFRSNSLMDVSEDR